MDTFADNQIIENIIFRFNEFREYVCGEFFSEIDCNLLISSVEFSEFFEGLYSIVYEYCTQEVNDKIAELVNILKGQDSLSVEEFEDTIFDICNMMDNMAYRHSSNIEDGIYQESSIIISGSLVGCDKSKSEIDVGCHEASNERIDEKTVETDAEEQEDIDAIIEYIKSATREKKIAWFECDWVETISKNFALNSLNINPYIKNKVDVDDVCDVKTYYAIYDYEKCVETLQANRECFAFNRDEETKDYEIALFITIKTKVGNVTNSLSLLNVPNDDLKNQQTLSGFFLYASEKPFDEIHRLVKVNIDEYNDLSEVDTEDVESIDMDINICSVKQKFLLFYKRLLKKCPDYLAADLIVDVDSALDSLNNRISIRKINKMTIQMRSLLRSLGIDPDETTDDTLVDELNITDHTKRCLKIAGIEKLSELTAMDNEKLMSVKSFGKRECVEILRVLDSLGHRLADCKKADYWNIEDFISEKYSDFSVDEDTELSRIQFSDKTTSELQKIGIKSVKELLECFYEDLENKCEFDSWCMEEIETFFSEHGYILKRKHPISAVDWPNIIKLLFDKQGIVFIEDLTALRMIDVILDYGPQGFLEIVQKLDTINYRLADCPKALYPDLTKIDMLFRCKKCGNLLFDRNSISLGYCYDCNSGTLKTKIGRCEKSKTISLVIGEPEYMSFSSGENGFVIYVDINVLCDKPIKLKLLETLIYSNGRQWARNYNYTGYVFSEEIVEPKNPQKAGWIWINEKWLIKELKADDYMTVTFKDSNKIIYCLKYVYTAGNWRFDDYYEIIDK